MFAKSDEILSLPVEDIKEKPKCRGQRMTKGNHCNRNSPWSLFFYNKCSSCGYQCVVFAKSDEIPSLPVQVIIKGKTKMSLIKTYKGQ